MNARTNGPGRKQLTRTKTVHPSRSNASSSTAIGRPKTPVPEHRRTRRKQAHHPGDTPPPPISPFPGQAVTKFEEDLDWQTETESDYDTNPDDSGVESGEVGPKSGYHSVWKAAKVHFGIDDDETEPEELNDDDEEMIDRYLDWEEEMLAAKPWSDPNEAMNWKKKLHGPSYLKD